MFGLGKGLGFGLAVKEVWDVAKHGLGETIGKVSGERVKTYLEQDFRPEVTHVIRVLMEERDQEAREAAEKILRRLDRAKKTGWPDLENNVFVVLGRLLPRDTSNKIVDEMAEKVYIWFANLDDWHYAVVVEGMKHNPIAQKVGSLISKAAAGPQFVAGYVLEVVTEALRVTPGVTKSAATTTASALKDGAVKVDGQLERFANWLDN